MSRLPLLVDNQPYGTLESSAVGNLGYLIKVVPVLLARNARMWARFRASMIMDIITGLAQASVFFFLGSMVHLSSLNYSTYVAIGIVANTIMSAGLNGPYKSLAMDYWMGRLETVLLSPCPITWALIADVCWAYIRALLDAIVFALLGWSFGAHLNGTLNNFILAILLLGIACVGVTGIGLMSAATFSLLNAKGWSDPVSWLVGILQGLVTGVYFPTSILPNWLQKISMVLPQTYVIDSARHLLDHQRYSNGITLTHDCVMLIFLSAIYLLFGGFLFSLGLLKSRKDGSLSRWT